MKLKTTQRPIGRAIATLAFTITSVLSVLPSYASEPDKPASGLESVITGLDTEQEQAIAKAREEQAKTGYSKQEEAAINLAVSKVSERVPVSREALTNLRIRSIQWPDSSLGCAEPGVEYLQKVVQGYLVNFKFDEEFYTVNVGDGRALICDRVNEFLLERKQRADSVIHAHRTARLDLAEKLMVDPEVVKVNKIKVETWADSSLGCPQPGQQYIAGPIEGLKINMTCRDKTYEYRVPLEGGEFISCKEIISCHETE
jgi:hypothetical protein